MFGLVTALIAAIASIAALVASTEPRSEEQARIQQARRQLHEAGFDYERNSPEEIRALRILLEGGPLSEC
jgi:hypothetical protein